MVSIARKTLFFDRVPFAVAQAGIIFSVSLVSIQMGLFWGFTRSTSIIVDRSRADIWVVSNKLQQLDLTLPIPYRRVAEARQVQGVDHAEPFLFQEATWQKGTQPIAPVTVIGIEPNSQLFRLESLAQGQQSDLKDPYTAILNDADMQDLGIDKLHSSALIRPFPVKIVGTTQGLRSVISSPYLFTSIESGYAYITTNATRNTPNNTTYPKFPAKLSSENDITAVLIRVKAGEDLQGLKRRLETALPNTHIYTRAELSQLTQTYWLNNTGVTFILGLGAVVAAIVGTVVVSQVLYLNVLRHLGEFATLKAMGASNGVLYKIVFEQAFWMALLGYLPGIALCVALGSWTAHTQAIQILVTPQIAAEVLGLTLGMGTISAVVAVQKVAGLDPALVFEP
ncbi:MAG TPA: ABC transporter permease [Stenomitos sp.]